MKILITGCIAFFFMSTTMLWAHGTHGGVIKSEGYLVIAEFNDGEPMNYAEVKIMAPDSDIPFQTGRTDLLGHFLFKPHSPGSWEIEVLDGMGHRLALELTVSDDIESETTNNINVMTGSNITCGKVVIGVSIIFGLSGLLYGWRARRFTNNVQREDAE